MTFVAPALHAAMVAPSGLDFHGTYADPAILAHPDLWHPQRGFAIVWRAVRPGLKELLPLVQALPPGPCVIVAHPLALPEAELCRAVREQVSVALAYLAPSNIPSVFDPLVMGPWKVPRWIPHAVRRWLWRQVGTRLIDPVALPQVNLDRARYALAPVSGLFRFMAEAPDLSVTLFPAWFAPPQPDWPTPLVCGEFPLHEPAPDAPFPPDLSAFLAAGEAPVVFTHGTGNQQAAAYFQCALAAVQQLGRRAIFLTPLREQVPAALPASVLWQPYLPFARLLPEAAALVHHGGIGTTAEALRAGIPQLIVSLAFDQFDNAARVAALGAGLELRYNQLTSQGLSVKLQLLLSSSSIRKQAGLISQRLATVPTLDHVLDAISKMASKTGKN
ncbi:MAG TPA: nucleotide disphospho-sugar-binding domain-containing protein [Telluria sp.]|nr:nucleotide disphospho-sugar-binding domain-containing protein [Telluria sp.]